MKTKFNSPKNFIFKPFLCVFPLLILYGCEPSPPELKEAEIPVETGIFGAMMDVQINNSGPVTIIIEKSPPSRR